MAKRNRVELTVFEFRLPSFVRELINAKVLCFTIKPLKCGFLVSAPRSVEDAFGKAFDKACNS